MGSLAQSVYSGMKRGVGSLGPSVAQSVAQHELSIEFDSQQKSIRDKSLSNPAGHGYKAFSQCDEDGILANILDRLPVSETTKTFVEVGASDGLENNTHLLLLAGYSGVWVEGSSQKCEFIRNNLPLPSERLRLENLMVGAGNAGALSKRCADFLGTSSPDLLSMDIDGNDYQVLEAMLTTLNPLVVVAEYNPKFRPPMVRIADVHEDGWSGDDYYGASLQALVDLLDEYQLVCCNLSGVNSFFVRSDVADDFDTAPISELYRPARHHLSYVKSGQRPSLRWLREELSE